SLFWSQRYPPDVPRLEPVLTITQEQIDARDIRVDLLEEDIRAANSDGVFYATYKIHDRAGNEAPFALQTRAVVFLQPGTG
ncbi:hypothetical protein NL393_38440, partial [Klebsiella pneumoniae]|nr:hypothetical protein [Klebsiella pneumoniae]